jgi:hypothetical protein
VTVEAVAMNWKWLFIYPELKIATVNQLALPVNTPVNFKITSDSIMNSFFIPQLGSQVYAMAGMETKLHLIANEAGTFDGMSANYSGGGFSGMKFKAIAMSNFEFDKWVEKVRASEKQLASEDYKVLAKPSEAEPVTYFGKVEDGLYTGILHQYMGGDGRAMAREGFDGGPVCTSRNTLGEERVSMATPAAGAGRANLGAMMFGKLSLSAIPFHEPIIMITLSCVALGGLALLGAITYFKKWDYLWTEWITSVDHKRIGVMYSLVALIMLLRGFADAVMMRTQLAVATNGSTGFLPPEHYDQCSRPTA